MGHSSLPKNTQFDVSIIIPTYNRVDLLPSALESCLKQKDCSVEIIVVDDGSEDKTAGLIADYQLAHQNIRYIKTEHKGSCHARNTGLKEACGEFVKFLDSDDLLVEDILREEVDCARRNKADMVYSNWAICYIDENGEEIANTRKEIYVKVIKEQLPDYLIDVYTIPTSCALYQREYMSDLSWNEDLVRYADCDLSCSVIIKGGKFQKSEKVVYIYRHHPGPRMVHAPIFIGAKCVYNIFDRITEYLRSNNLLTQERAARMAENYYKNIITICENDKQLFRETLDKMHTICPNFSPSGKKPLFRYCLVRVFGIKNGILLWCWGKRCIYFIKGRGPSVKTPTLKSG